MSKDEQAQTTRAPEHQAGLPSPALSALPATFGSRQPALEYMIDAAQRNVLYWDVMRQRGNECHRASETVTHVLEFASEPVLDGRELERPVNYGLVRIIPPKSVTIDPKLRPFVVIDPRAGHGPGIGGFKAESEIGVALKAGHPCYFVGFLPEPVPGQTIEDVARAEAVFLEHVIARHPEAVGKPCVIGNCQAGWAVMILAAMRPDLFGPIIIAGSPLSYWAGVHGKNPMRYSGGLLGGSWLTALTSDIGGGKFDGSWLVQNFENLNPANALWTKQYKLYSKIDTESSRYLEFESWWGRHINLNAEEIQFIVDELFVGNNLAAGRVALSDGTAIDLRNAPSPIVVFCSKGDNITPPQQALDWILDLYRDVDEIRAFGQTIVYTIHESIGHLGIFVSGEVARKQYGEFSNNIDLIDVLPPGLYEAVFEPKTRETKGADLVGGNWIMRCEERTLDDIRALGGNNAVDERSFATVAKVSEINLALYRTFLQPFVRALVSQPFSEMTRALHPLRLKYEIFSDLNPLMSSVAAVAVEVRKHRAPTSTDNPFLALQEAASERIIAALDAWRDLRDATSEAAFFAIFGSPILQAAVGIDPHDTRRPRRSGTNPLYQALAKARIAGLKAKIRKGGLAEAAVRTLIYILMPRAAVDERVFQAIRRLRTVHLDQKWSPVPELTAVTLPEFKTLVREQFFMLVFDQEAALAAIPALLPKDPEIRSRVFQMLRELSGAPTEITGEVANRLTEAALWFGVAPKRLSGALAARHAMPTENR